MATGELPSEFELLYAQALELLKAFPEYQPKTVAAFEAVIDLPPAVVETFRMGPALPASYLRVNPILSVAGIVVVWLSCGRWGPSQSQGREEPQ
jgi:hypothetical protein